MSVDIAGFSPPNLPLPVFDRARLPGFVRSLAFGYLLGVAGMTAGCEVAEAVTAPFALALEIACDIGDCSGDQTYGPGEKIPYFPTSVTLDEISDGKILSNGDSLTITLEVFGKVTKSDYTFSCVSNSPPAPCTIVDGVVTEGEVFREATYYPPGSNRSPVWVGSVPDQVLNAGGMPLVLDLKRNFVDPDDDPLVLTASSSRENVARVVISGNQLEITPVSDGTTVIQVTATDPDGLSASQSFEIAVGNVAPRAEGMWTGFSLAEGGEVLVSLDLEGASGDPIFQDPNGDPLVYAATSTNRGVVRVMRVDESGAVLSLLLSPVQAGTATIAVTATDPEGLSAESQFPMAVGDGDGPLTITISKCESQARAGGNLRVTIEGNLRADRTLRFATVRGYVNGEYAGFDHLSVVAGVPSETFFISEFVDATAEIRCGAIIAW